jgi:hypothetical protein
LGPRSLWPAKESAGSVMPRVPLVIVSLSLITVSMMKP